MRFPEPKLASVVLAAIFCTAASPPSPKPAVGPVPGWLTPLPIPGPNPKTTKSALQNLLVRTADLFTANGLHSYVEYSAVAHTSGGLQGIGTVAVPWAVERADLIFHEISLSRSGKQIDLLKDADFTVIRRENQLEKSQLDGIYTVVLTPKDLQVDDTMKVALSYAMRPQFVGKPEQIQSWSTRTPVRHFERRFIVPDDVEIAWKASTPVPEPKIEKGGGRTQYVFAQQDVEPAKVPSNAPARFKAPIIQFTSYRDWSEVAQPLIPLFGEARKLGKDSAVRTEATKLAQSTGSPERQLLAALRLAQEKVRYVALLLNEGTYRPTSAEETWAQKFGDCKAKTALLLALLDEMQIPAEPLVVSTTLDDSLRDSLPSLAMFDHVIVRAFVNGRAYYLDATDYGQRTTEELARPTVHWGLPLRQGAKLERLQQPLPGAPTRETQVVWDTSKGRDGEVPFTAKLTLRGPAAAYFRAKLDASTDLSALDEEFKELVPGISNDQLEIDNRDPEMPDGSFVVAFKGKAEMDWTPYDGERTPRYQFDHSVPKWEVDFERDEGKWKDLPVALPGAVWLRSVETVILPQAGRGYRVESADIAAMVAGAEIKRSVRQTGDRVTATADFRRVSEEISADEARAGKTKMAEINESYAWIVGRR